MAFYCKEEAGDAHAGGFHLGSCYANEALHQAVMSRRAELLSIVNRHTVDLTESRLTGIMACSPQATEVRVCCNKTFRAVNPETIEAIGPYINYWVEVFCPHQVISMPERQAMERDAGEWFENLLGENRIPPHGG